MTNINYPEAILNLRAKLDLSQEEVANLLGVSFTSVNRWENGKHEPTKIAKVKLQKLFKENEIEVEEVND